MTCYKQCCECSHVTELPAAQCSYCNSAVSFPSMRDRVHGVSIFPSGYFRDIDINPVYCKGRHDLQAETRGRGQVSHYAED